MYYSFHMTAIRQFKGCVYVGGKQPILTYDSDNSLARRKQFSLSSDNHVKLGDFTQNTR